MAKADVDIISHDEAEIQLILSDFTNQNFLSHKKLFGGYSGSNYLIEIENDNTEKSTKDLGSKFVLKIMNGYTKDYATGIAAIQAFLCRHDFKSVCYALHFLTDDNEFVSTKERHGSPACLLTFMEGKPADKIVREIEAPNSEKNNHESKEAAQHFIFSGVGKGLAAMHAVALNAKDKNEVLKLRSYLKNGCCLVGEHVEEKFKNKIDNCGFEDVLNSEFRVFYTTRLEKLMKPEIAFSENDLPSGVLHGDPFFDNIFVNENTGTFSAFVDMEDTCIGPLLFDLACCVIGSCYETDEKNVNGGRDILNFTYLKALLAGYCEERKLIQNEVEHFVSFMKLTLLCNCSWRYVNFNIDHREIEDCKNTFVELKERIVDLEEKPELGEKILGVLKTANGM